MLKRRDFLVPFILFIGESVLTYSYRQDVATELLAFELLHGNCPLFFVDEVSVGTIVKVLELAGFDSEVAQELFPLLEKNCN